LKNREGLISSDGHDPFVVPAFTYLSGDKGMPEIMEMKPVEFGLAVCGCL
jgi:hypothetical protein